MPSLFQGAQTLAGRQRVAHTGVGCEIPSAAALNKDVVYVFVLGGGGGALLLSSGCKRFLDVPVLKKNWEGFDEAFGRARRHRSLPVHDSLGAKGPCHFFVELGLLDGCGRREFSFL